MANSQPLGLKQLFNSKATVDGFRAASRNEITQRQVLSRERLMSRNRDIGEISANEEAAGSDKNHESNPKKTAKQQQLLLKLEQYKQEKAKRQLEERRQRPKPFVAGGKSSSLPLPVQCPFVAIKEKVAPPAAKEKVLASKRSQIPVKRGTNDLGSKIPLPFVQRPKPNPASKAPEIVNGSSTVGLSTQNKQPPTAIIVDTEKAADVWKPNLNETFEIVEVEEKATTSEFVPNATSSPSTDVDQQNICVGGMKPALDFNICPSVTMEKGPRNSLIFMVAVDVNVSVENHEKSNTANMPAQDSMVKQDDQLFPILSDVEPVSMTIAKVSDHTTVQVDDRQLRTPDDGKAHDVGDDIDEDASSVRRSSRRTRFQGSFNTSGKIATTPSRRRSRCTQSNAPSITWPLNFGENEEGILETELPDFLTTRSPMDDDEFLTRYMAYMALSNYSTQKQSDKIDVAIVQKQNDLLKTPLSVNSDDTFRTASNNSPKDLMKFTVRRSLSDSDLTAPTFETAQRDNTLRALPATPVSILRKNFGFTSTQKKKVRFRNLTEGSPVTSDFSLSTSVQCHSLRSPASGFLEPRQEDEKLIDF